MIAVTTKDYCKQSLALPFLLPLPLVVGFAQCETSDSGIASLISFVWAGSIFYIPVALILLWWMRDKTGEEAYRSLLYSPLFMPIVLLPLFAPLGVTNTGVVDGLNFGVLLSLCSIVIGYAYVLLASCGLWLFKKLHWVEDED